jgi:hypothetical protein
VPALKFRGEAVSSGDHLRKPAPPSL